MDKESTHNKPWRDNPDQDVELINILSEGTNLVTQVDVSQIED